MTPAERFEAKYAPEALTGCWLWYGATGDGYGLFGVKRRLVKAHRFSYEKHRGAIPKGMVLDHLCRNRSCVNPDHLEVVTFKENVLRGIGPTAINAAKTHCPLGHEYHRRADGNRRCRTCKNASEKLRKRQVRAKKRAS